MKVKVLAEDVNDLRPDVEAFFRSIANLKVEEEAVPKDEDVRRDPASAVAIATLVLAVPSAVLATVELADRFELRRRTNEALEKLKRRLAESSADAVLEVGGKPLSLLHTSSDIVVDLLVKDLGG